LPDPPIDPKLLHYQHNTSSLIDYRATSLDERFRWELALEPEALFANYDFIRRRSDHALALLLEVGFFGHNI
jgi:hypothetical protein